jgi:hypothetical protein
MAGFETVVRPVVFPDIRPRAKQSLPPPNDSASGFAVIRGNPAQSVGMSDNWSVSTSQQRPQETERRFDVMRVSQMNDDGSVQPENFVDLEVANRITMRDSKGGLTKYSYARMDDEKDNIQVLNRDQVRKAKT